MNMKTLLGTAAGLMVATGAYAADLPGDAAPAAVDYVKVCDSFGKGYFNIPGTETCIKIGGRVRAGLEYKFNEASTSASATTYKDTVNFTGSGRITLDSQSATDLGTLHTYARFTGNSGEGTTVAQAFIQLGYLTVGRQEDIANGDFLIGDNGLTQSTGSFGDNPVNGLTVLVDNLGGGFYVGAGVYAKDKSFWYDNNTSKDGYNGTFEASAGIAKQSWGDFDLSGEYRVYTDDAKNASDYYGVKGTLNVNLIDKLKGSASAIYYHDEKDNDNTVLALAASYDVTDSLTVYTGGLYAIRDAKGVDDGYGLQLGANYTVVPGLTLTGEVNYLDDDYVNDEQGTKGVTSGILRLERLF